MPAYAYSPIIVDIETFPLENAQQYLEPVQPAKNLKDPEKIKADIKQRTIERDDRIALDWNVARIAAVAWWTEDDGTHVHLGQSEDLELIALSLFWRAAKNRTIIGFGVKGFDLRFLIQRSRYLGVSYPRLDIGKYSKGGVIDLFLDLTFNDGHFENGAMRRTLQAFCRRFGIQVDDTMQGKDIPALAMAGKWTAVTTHVQSDLALTLALARRLGVVRAEKDEHDDNSAAEMSEVR